MRFTGTGPMRSRLEAEPSVRLANEIVEDDDGLVILRFKPGSKRSVTEWATFPGTLEDDDEL